jgi:hypothetical protein
MTTINERVTLPADVIPSHYSLEVTPNLDKLDFHSSLDILCNVLKEEVSEITLHSKEIFIESVTFNSIGNLFLLNLSNNLNSVTGYRF